jgi:hypothetical protein
MGTPDADVSAIADAMVKVVDMPFGKRPFRLHVDPAQDGAEDVNAVADRVRAEFLRRIGLEDLPTTSTSRTTAGLPPDRVTIFWPGGILFYFKFLENLAPCKVCSKPDEERTRRS